MIEFSTLAPLLVAGLAGLAVGIEREWSGHATGPSARFAGVRTFLLLGLLGGTAGLLLRAGFEWGGAALLLGGATLTTAAYVMAARPGGEAIEGTTEAAALVVMALGTLAGLGRTGPAAAAAALVVLALGEKSQIHRFIQRIDTLEMRAALQFAVMALVLLPILPEGPFGPLGGIRPRSLWLVVLIFSGLNFAGYLARRAVGESRGLTVTGLLGGLISSTAVTLNFARYSRESPALGPALGLGTVAASVMLLFRVLLVTLVLNSAVCTVLVPFLIPALLVGAGFLVIALRRHGALASASAALEPANPLRLGNAVMMAVAFQAVLLAISFVQERWGSPGVLASAAFLGLTDMDALTLSMSRLGIAGTAAALGAQAIAIGILTNGLLKSTVAALVGERSYRRVALPGLGALILGSALGIWLRW